MATLLLLPFNDNVTDSTSRHSPSAINSPSYVTSKNGFAKAIYLNGSSQFVRIADSTDWNFGTSNFTIECFANFDTLQTSHIVSQWGDGGESNRAFSLNLRDGNKLQFAYISSSSQTDLYSDTLSLSIGTWYHIAVVRDGSLIRFFVGGVAKGTGSIGTDSIDDSTRNLNIGTYKDGGGEWLAGKVDDLRIKDSAIYTTDFTPPSTPFVLPTASLSLKRSANQRLYQNQLNIIKSQQQHNTAAILPKRNSLFLHPEVQVNIRRSAKLNKGADLIPVRNSKTASAARLSIARNANVAQIADLAISLECKTLQESRLNISRLNLAPEGWEIYINNTYYGFIDSDGSGILNNISLADGTHTIEARPSGNLWHGLFTGKDLTVVVSGGEIVEELPGIIDLSVSDYAAIRYLSWSWQDDYGVETPEDFAVWTSAATPVVTTGDPDYTIEAGSAGANHWLPFSHSADLYIAICARDSEGVKGTVSEILASYPSASITSPEFQFAKD